MATNWKSQQGDGMYSLQFKTDDMDKYKLVEKASRMAIDGIADVGEVKHGHWIWLEGNLYECSECPNRTEVDEAMNEPLYIYCPFCGAKMDGGVE